jgi:hypothetical protein
MILLRLLETWTEYLLFDLQLLQSEVQLFVSAQDGSRDVERHKGLLRVGRRGRLGSGMCGVRTLPETALLSLLLLFLPAGLEEIVLEQVFSIEGPAQLLHESDLLLPKLQDLLGDIVLQRE